MKDQLMRTGHSASPETDITYLLYVVLELFWHNFHRLSKTIRARFENEARLNNRQDLTVPVSDTRLDRGTWHRSSSAAGYRERLTVPTPRNASSSPAPRAIVRRTKTRMPPNSKEQHRPKAVATTIQASWSVSVTIAKGGDWPGGTTNEPCIGIAKSIGSFAQRKNNVQRLLR